MAQSIDRSSVHKKYDGHCGYCGKSITLKEMQVDHMNPVWSAKDNTVHDFDNLMPSCRRCNHYKRADNVEQFRLSMKGLHKRLEKIYINKVAVDYGMIDIKPFDGVFYFEKLKTK
jgi:5-methylcytosine-specific restriction endonuclease McrA